MSRRPPLLLVSLLGALSLWPSQALAQVQRCTAADGSTVFTDRRCVDIGGVERLPRHQPQRANLASPAGCAHNLQTLVFEITAAIDAHNVNRLASVYLWRGLSNRQGYAVLTRLTTLVQQPLIDITPIMPRHLEETLDSHHSTQTSVRRPPVGLRIQQTLANGHTPENTVFGLQQYFDCWWIKG